MENLWQKNMASLKTSTKMDAFLPKCITSCWGKHRGENGESLVVVKLMLYCIGQMHCKSWLHCFVSVVQLKYYVTVTSSYVFSTIQYVFNLLQIDKCMQLLVSKVRCPQLTVKQQQQKKTETGGGQGKQIFIKKLKCIIFLVFFSSTNSIDSGRRWCGGR